jgi:predicted phage terminase large subunit-like protein
MLVLPSQTELRAERCRRSLAAFIGECWAIVEPATRFVANWHLEAICEHLEAASRGELRRLVINLPPRHMKSLSVSVFWPAWCWLTHPERRFIYASYSSALSSSHSLVCRRLVRSRGTRPRAGLDPREVGVVERLGYVGLLELIFGAEAWALCGDQNRKLRFDNTRTGFRLATSVGGSVTGEGGDVLVLDDPHKPEEAQSDAVREGVINWHDQTWTTRLNDAESGVQVIVMQRLHERDLTGHVLERGGYEHLCLPAEYEPAHPFRWPRDPRTEPAEVLWKEKWDRPWLTVKAQELGSYGYAGQYQQRPSPAEGGIFKRAWWRRYAAPPELSEAICSWDMAFRGSDGSDYVVGQLWGRDRADKYLLAQIRARLDFTETVGAVKALHEWAQERWRVGAILVEEAANGHAVISALRHELSALIAVKPEGGKEARAHAASPQIEAGNVYLPAAQIPAPPGYPATAADELIEECAAFPNGAHDDQVDALTQALIRLSGRPPGEYKPPDPGRTITGGLLRREF